MLGYGSGVCYVCVRMENDQEKYYSDSIRAQYRRISTNRVPKCNRGSLRQLVERYNEFLKEVYSKEIRFSTIIDNKYVDSFKNWLWIGCELSAS